MAGATTIRARFVRYGGARLARYPRLYLRVLQALAPHDQERVAYVALVRDGDVVLDIGANVGRFTLLFADLVGPGGRVHAFEPVEQTFQSLTSTVAREARYGNVVLNHAACGSREAQVELWVPPGDPAQASLLVQDAGSWRRPGKPTSERAFMICVDDYLRRIGASRVDFVKCDVEGAELECLLGMQSTLQRHRPILALEAHEDWTRAFGYRPRDLAAWVRDRGYDLFAAIEGGGARLFDACAAEREYQHGITLICADSTRHRSRLTRLPLRNAQALGRGSRT